jgi:predicted Rossmann fold nucleotide-binding protein DprA/Smf involved in DNA uptake
MVAMQTNRIDRQSFSYPAILVECLGDRAPAALHLIGDPALLELHALALFSSVKCPGAIILSMYDFAVTLCDVNIPTIGGFHSPMERECLAILLRGTSPIIVCPARSIVTMRIPAEWSTAIEQRRLLILSPFSESVRRSTVETARYRNLLVAALASHILVAYAEPSGSTEQLCREALAWGKPLSTFDRPENHRLLSLGAKPSSPANLKAWVEQLGTSIFNFPIGGPQRS